MNTLPRYVPTPLAEKYREQMDRPDLVFVTQENQAQMARELAERRATCKHDFEKIVTPAVGSLPEVERSVCRLCLIDETDWNKALSAVEGASRENE